MIQVLEELMLQLRVRREVQLLEKLCCCTNALLLRRYLAG